MFLCTKICDISEYYITFTLVVIWETTIKNVKDHKEVAVELHYITLQIFIFYLGVWGRGKPGNSSSKFTGKERGELKKALLMSCNQRISQGRTHGEADMSLQLQWHCNDLGYRNVPTVAAVVVLEFCSQVAQWILVYDLIKMKHLR